jgi:hypothetical protein
MVKRSACCDGGTGLTGRALHSLPIPKCLTALRRQPGPGVMGGWGQPTSDASAGDMKMPGRKRDLQAEVERLREIVASTGVWERDELRAELAG